MHRFFVLEGLIDRDKVFLKDEQAHQILHVLRLKPADHIMVVDNAGWEYEVEIEKAGSELVQGRVLKKAVCANEPGIKITLFQALLKTNKFEFVLQKGVELGVGAFVPFVSERCIVKKAEASKIARWEKIIREATEQSRRALLPVLHPVVSFQEACDMACDGASILLWEEEKSTGLGSTLKTPSFQNISSINLFIGPEGGFPLTEVEYAKAKGIIPVRLGCRILRAETAGLAVASAILYEMGEFG